MRLLALGVAAVAASSVSVTAPPSTVKEFSAGKMQVHVHCDAVCDVAVSVEVSSTTARKLGMLSFKNPSPIGTANAKAHPPGDFDLTISPTGTDVQAASGFPLFKRLPVTIVGQVDNAKSSAATSLPWPKQRAERGGHGDGPYIKSITGPRKVSLRSRFASFRVRITRIPARIFTAIVVTPGNHFTPVARDALPKKVADTGGTFTIKLPIRSTRGRADAAKLAPLAAELSLGVVTKKAGDSAIFRFTLVK